MASTTRPTTRRRSDRRLRSRGFNNYIVQSPIILSFFRTLARDHNRIIVHLIGFFNLIRSSVIWFWLTAVYRGSQLDVKVGFELMDQEASLRWIKKDLNRRSKLSAELTMIRYDVTWSKRWLYDSYLEWETALAGICVCYYLLLYCRYFDWFCMVDNLSVILLIRLLVYRRLRYGKRKRNFYTSSRSQFPYNRRIFVPIVVTMQKFHIRLSIVFCWKHATYLFCKSDFKPQ